MYNDFPEIHLAGAISHISCALCSVANYFGIDARAEEPVPNLPGVTMSRPVGTCVRVRVPVRVRVRVCMCVCACVYVCVRARLCRRCRGSGCGCMFGWIYILVWMYACVLRMKETWLKGFGPHGKIGQIQSFLGFSH
jgi:hypothetical protein